MAVVEKKKTEGAQIVRKMFPLSNFFLGSREIFFTPGGGFGRFVGFFWCGSMFCSLGCLFFFGVLVLTLHLLVVLDGFWPGSLFED